MRTRHGLILAAFLAPFLVRDFTVANELRYISIAQEALDGGTWFTFFNHGAAYADKPPLYLWLAMLTRFLGAWQMPVLALASILPAVGILGVMERWVRRERPDFDAQTADLLLATTGMFLGSALVLRMDMLMSLFIVLALRSFYRCYTGCGAPRERWLLPVWIFAALFTKGPLGVLAPLVAIAAFLGSKRELSHFGRWFGWRQWVVLGALAALWFGAVYAEGGRSYIENLLFKQTVGRGIDSFHHKGPVWYYVVHLPVAFAPWVLLYLGLWIAGVRRKLVRSDLERLFLSAFLSVFVLLSLISSKLDIYLLPVYPFAVFLAVLWLKGREERWYVRIGTLIPALLFALIPFAAIYTAATGRFIPRGMEVGAALYIAVGAIGIGGIGALIHLARHRTRQAIRWCGWGVMGLLVAGSFAIPSFNPEIGVGALAKAGQTLHETGGGHGYAYYRFRGGADMDVYLGSPVERVDRVPQLEALDEGPRRVLFIGHKEPRRDSTLRRWLAGRPAVRVGPYRALLIGKTNDHE